MRKSGWITGLLVLVLATAAGGRWWQQSQAKTMAGGQAAKASADPASAVPLAFRSNEVVQPSHASLPDVIEFSGPLVAPNTAVLRAKTAGTLLSLQVVEGVQVKAGQLLGRIDMAELDSRMAERNAQLESARALLVQAQRSHASNERLAAQNFISASALDNSRAQLDTARAALAAAQASLATTSVGLRDATLLAPIAGIVAKRHVLPGEKVSAEQPVLTLVDLARLELAGNVGTHEVSRLAPGMAVSVQVEGLAQPIAGRLARIAPAAEPGTRAIGVSVSLANEQQRLRAGQYALARLQLPDEKLRLLLPQAAVGSSSGQPHVWLIAQGKLLRRAVTLGRRDDAGGRVEVLDGLSDKDQVLAARFDNLREGAPANVLTAVAAALARDAASGAASGAAIGSTSAALR